MTDNDADKFSIKLTEMPPSLQFSISTVDKVDFEKAEPKILSSLLQVTVKERVMVYNIEDQAEAEADDKPQELCVFNATSQLDRPDTFVDSGF